MAFSEFPTVNIIFPEILKDAKRLQKAGVKVITRFAISSTGANFMRISEKADLREKMAESILAVMEQLQLDGLFLQWMWPGCPDVKLKVKLFNDDFSKQNIDRALTANLPNHTEITQWNSFLQSAGL
jgi:hypothetical protein